MLVAGRRKFISLVYTYIQNHKFTNIDIDLKKSVCNEHFAAHRKLFKFALSKLMTAVSRPGHALCPRLLGRARNKVCCCVLLLSDL